MRGCSVTLSELEDAVGNRSWSRTTATGSELASRLREIRWREEAESKSLFTGHWRIVSMSAWEDEYLDEEVQAFFEFEETGTGSFQFGYIQGLMDCRKTSREGNLRWSSPGREGTELTAPC